MNGDHASALYFGTVIHKRLRPRQHRLRYRVFSMLVDLDEIPSLVGNLRLFSRNRFNLFSFHDSDHGDGSGDLRAHVEKGLASAGLNFNGGPIRLLCVPRMLGYAFNPLSVYFCYRKDGSLGAILYEVNNTFAQRHSYLIPVGADPGLPIRQRCDKNFYVSPFLAVAGGYDFEIIPPAARVSIGVGHFDCDGPILEALLVGARKPLSDAALIAAFVRYPLVTLKVMAGIHWEAFKLWRKGIALHRRPAPPEHAVTIVPPSESPEPTAHVATRI